MEADQKRLSNTRPGTEFRWWVLTACAAFGGLAPLAVEARPARHLRDTGLFFGGSSTQVRAENLPFSPQYPLWTDGAVKRRWIYLPRGKSIDASRPGEWKFPVGTRLWKEFSFGRRIETRYIERLPNGKWYYATYVWNDEGTDAVLAPEMGIPVAIGGGRRHFVPGQTDCRACHEGRSTPVLGFSALQLSTDRDPLAPHAEPVRPGDVNLQTLVARHLVRGLPRALSVTPPRITATSATERAALGYLHANCGHCHNEDGPLAPLGMSLSQRIGSGESGASFVIRSIAHQPSRFRVPGWQDTVRMLPGHPEQSAITYRMRARDPISAMPPLGTSEQDHDGLTLIERWIAQDLQITHPNPNIETAPSP